MGDAKRKKQTEEAHGYETVAIPRELALELREAIANQRAASAELRLAQQNAQLVEETFARARDAVLGHVSDGGAYEIVAVAEDPNVLRLDLQKCTATRKLTPFGEARAEAQRKAAEEQPLAFDRSTVPAESVQ